MIRNIYTVIILTFFIFSNQKNLYAEKPIYKVEGKTITYTDNNSLITAIGDAYAIDQFGREIFSDKIIYEKNKSIIRTEKNSVYLDKKGYRLLATDFFYDLNLNEIMATGNAYAIDQSGKEVFSDKIIYEKNKSIIRTKKNSVYLDGKGNRLLATNFHYDLNLKKIKAFKDVNYFTKEGDHFTFSFFEYHEIPEKGSGLNFKGILADQTVLEGPKADVDNKKGITTVNKNKNKYFNYFSSLFTSYNNRNSYTPCINEKFTIKNTVKERCPDWSMTSTQTTHDKNEKMLYHEGVLIHLRNIPVFYTPYFSHPDPSVKRKTGLLPPVLKNFTNLGRTLKTPYFWVIDDNKDLTFTPIIYFQENSVFLGEYRQKNKNSEFYIDTSYTDGYKRLDKQDDSGVVIPRKAGSRHHYFFNFKGNYKDLLLENNDVEINIQKISQANYLKVHQINTLYVKEDTTSLESNVSLNAYSGGKNIKVSSSISEDITNNNPNTKYGYTIPSIGFFNYFNKYNQFINTSNDFKAVNSGGDTKRVHQNNSISTSSEVKTFKALPSIGNEFKTRLNNINVYNENVSGAKANMNSDAFLTVAVENTYPLMKIKDKTEQTITPKLFSKYTEGSMNNDLQGTKILSYSDIYSIDRNNVSVTNPETGVSFGYGGEYNIIKKNLENSVYIDGRFSIGQVLRTSKLEGMPSNSSLKEEHSDFVGKVYFNLKNPNATSLEKEEYKSKYYNLNFDFNYIINNDFNKFLQNNLKTTFENKKNIFSSEYSETHDISDSHSISGEYQRKFDNNLNFIIGAKKNIQESFLERSNIELNYESDCLKVGLTLAKTFYQREDVKPDKNLTFSITLMPFGSPIAPDLSDFLEQY